MGGSPARNGTGTEGEHDEPRVLVVDDHDLFRTGLVNLLAEQGVHVVGEAPNGETALRLVRELAPDVVIMDLNMPGISGVDATREIADGRAADAASSSSRSPPTATTWSTR